MPSWKSFVLRSLSIRRTILCPPIMTQSKSLFFKALIFKHNEQWRFQNQSPENSHACVPFKIRKIPEILKWSLTKKELREGTPTTRIVDLHHFNADPDPGPHKGMRIFDYWSKDPTKLHYEHIRLHCERPWPSMGPFWTSLLLNRRGSGSSLSLQCGSGSGASFLNCGTMQIQICNLAYIPAKTRCNARHCEFSKLLCRACLHPFFIDRQSTRELRITRILRDAVI